MSEMTSIATSSAADTDLRGWARSSGRSGEAKPMTDPRVMGISADARVDGSLAGGQAERSAHVPPKPKRRRRPRRAR